MQTLDSEKIVEEGYDRVGERYARSAARDRPRIEFRSRYI